MRDQAEPGGEELEAVRYVLLLGDVFVVCAHLEDRRLWQGAVDNADADTGLLKDFAVLQHTGDAAAALLALPLIHLELGAIHLFQRPHDLSLLLFGELFHA